MITVLYAVLVLGGLGLIFAVSLGFAGRFLAIEEDPRKVQLLEILPGVNCGACGLAGCASYADLLVEGKVSIDCCSVGQQLVVDKIAKLLEKEIVVKESKIAFIGCSASDQQLSRKFKYQGVNTCRAAVLIGGGDKSCPYGCLMYGDCVTVCPFDAIKTVSGKPPVVDVNKCTGCGICVNTCPKKIICLVPDKSKIKVVCSSHDKGKDTRAVCKVGCIACGICVKNCPEKAITVIDNVAVIDYFKCTACNKCGEKCPTKCIIQEDIQITTAVEEKDKLVNESTEVKQ